MFDYFNENPPKKGWGYMRREAIKGYLQLFLFKTYFTQWSWYWIIKSTPGPDFLVGGYLLKYGNLKFIMRYLYPFRHILGWSTCSPSKNFLLIVDKSMFGGWGRGGTHLHENGAKKAPGISDGRHYDWFVRLLFQEKI